MKALDKKSIYSFLNSFSFPRESYWILMGAALVLHGVKEVTNDIDLGCTDELFQQLIERGYSSKISSSGRRRIDYSNEIHIYKNWDSEKNVINGYNVSSIKSIINDKRSFSRDKDLADIKLIKIWVTKNGKIL